MIRILIVDDQQAQLDRGARLIKETFEILDIRPVIQTHCLGSTSSLDKATYSLTNEALKTRPHIIICDNKIGESHAWGQKFLAQIKTQIPEIVTCMMTREILKCAQFGLHTPNPDVIIDKGQLGGSSAEYRKHIARKLTGSITRSTRLTITWETPFEEIFGSLKDRNDKKATEEKIQSLIEQCFYDGAIESDEHSVIIEKLAGGKSGSAVLACRLSGKLSYGVTGVMKISRRDEAESEYQNYSRFVKWVLPYTWRVEALGTGFTDSFGAVCYSFAFDGDGKPRSCSDLLKRADSQIIKLLCETIFNPENKTWYNQMRMSREDACQYFQSPPYFSRSNQVQDREVRYLDEMKKIFPRDFSCSETEMRLFGIKAELPNRLLFTNDWGTVEECVCHGDLNANNVLVNSERHAIAFIDFQKTGYHNMFRDFISFESSIRIEWGEVLDMANLGAALREEIALATDDGPVTWNYLRQVQLIRNVAFANFPPDSEGRRKKLHLIASFVHFSWLATRFSDWTAEGYARLLLGAYAALVALGRLEQR